ncbi:hypothetical protein RJ639_012524 [Escallonia herrerae]|uniref:Malectin domain-containing protein n=1 Tax=Escallonia herrerae TaxID=1293975 RepID=A0AA88VKD5_9ASTE|nr:hypothetical protein RJ639_012524 [Escallonia herrerae]
MVIAFILVRIGEAETKSFLINCGTNSSVNVDGRRWVGDTAPGNINVTLSSEGIEAFTASFTGDSLYAPLYTTALMFTDSLNYTFEGMNGSYFLRLHFYPFSFENHNVNDSSFAVELNGLKLVSECNVPNEIAHKNSYLQSSGGNSSLSTLVKEFFFNVEGDAIALEFVPTKGSFGFVSAIEIIPVMKGADVGARKMDLHNLEVISISTPSFQAKQEPPKKKFPRRGNKAVIVKTERVKDEGEMRRRSRRRDSFCEKKNVRIKLSDILPEGPDTRRASKPPNVPCNQNHGDGDEREIGSV